MVAPSLLSLLCPSSCPAGFPVPACPGHPPAVPASQSSGQPQPCLDPSPSRSSFPSELPAARLSQLPCFPCPSPVCTFSVPSSLGSSGWRAVEALSVVTGPVECFAFQSRKVSVIFGVFLPPAAGAPAMQGHWTRDLSNTSQGAPAVGMVRSCWNKEGR